MKPKHSKTFQHEGLDRTTMILNQLESALGFPESDGSEGDGSDVHPSIYNDKCRRHLKKAFKHLSKLYQSIDEWEEGEDMDVSVATGAMETLPSQPVPGDMAFCVLDTPCRVFQAGSMYPVEGSGYGEEDDPNSAYFITCGIMIGLPFWKHFKFIPKMGV